jgi:hypothetical protein
MRRHVQAATRRRRSGAAAAPTRHPPIAFYSTVWLGDSEILKKIMQSDAYFITQDNGAGAPLHFAATYCRLDMVRAR